MAQESQQIEQPTPSITPEVRWWTIMGIGGTASLHVLTGVFFLNLIAAGFILLFGSVLLLDPEPLGFLLYLSSWAPILEISPHDIQAARWLAALLAVSTYQVIMISFAANIDPESPLPWWKQLQNIKKPRGESYALSILAMTAYHVILLLSTLYLLPKDTSQPVQMLVPIFKSFLELELAQGVGLLIWYFLAVTLASIFIVLALIVLFEDQKDPESNFYSRWNKVKQFWYEWPALLVALPVILILLMLGGILLLFFPVLIFNFVTNGTLLILTGSLMTYIMEILLIVFLLLYPIYPAMTWGQYFRIRISKPQARGQLNSDEKPVNVAVSNQNAR